MNLASLTFILLFLIGCASTPPTRTYRPKIAEKHLQEGLKALLERDTSTAIAELNRCIVADERRLRCHWELGWAYYRESDWKKASERWNFVNSYYPEMEGIEVFLPRVESLAKIVETMNRVKKQAPKTLPVGTSKRTLRLRAVGDVMMGTTYPSKKYLPPKDGARLFKDVRDWLREGDLTFANLEGAICGKAKTKKCEKSENKDKCYAFRTPPHYIKYLKRAGVDIVSLANNHATDFGEECREKMENLLTRNKIRWSGREGTIASFRKKGLRIALIGYHTSSHSNHLNDLPKAVGFIRQFRKKHDVIIVSFHGGAEGLDAIRVPRGEETFMGEERGNLRLFARKMIDNGADIVLGHGPHVVRGMELYKDRLIVYSLGNFLTYGRFNLASYHALGMVLDVVLDEKGKFLGGKILPTFQAGLGIPKKDPSARTVDLVRALSQMDFPQRGVAVALDGTLGPNRGIPLEAD